MERDIDRTELYMADELFLCGTGSEIIPVASVDGFAVGDGKPGAVTRQLVGLYENIVRGIDARYEAWRTLV